MSYPESPADPSAAEEQIPTGHCVVVRVLPALKAHSGAQKQLPSWKQKRQLSFPPKQLEFNH